MRARVLLVYCFALVPAVAMAAFQPVWSRVDEAQHADVLAQYADGNFPIEGVSTLRPEIVAVDQATGIYRWNPPGSGPAPVETDPRDFVRPPAGASAAAKQAWTARHLWGFSYEAMQPPLYYLLAEPEWLLGDRFGGTLGAIYAARLFSAIIAACLAPLAYMLALLIRPSSQGTALFAAGLAALLPGYVLNASQITNDGLAAVLGAGLTLVAVKGARDGWTTRLAVGCGLLLGAAAMTKLTAVGLTPLVAAAFLWPNVQPLRSRIVSGLIAAGIAAAVIAPWILFNLHAYGQPLPSQATRTLLGAVFGPPSRSAGYVIGSVKSVVGEFIAGEPYGVIPYTKQLHWFEGVCALLAAIGLWRGRRRLRLELLLLFGFAADFVWVLTTPFLSGVGGLMPGRYLYPAAAAGLVVVAAGFDTLPRLVSRTVTVAGCAGAAVVLVLLATVPSAPAARPQPALPAAAGITVDAQTEVAGLEVVADRVVIANDGRTVWVHVTVTDLSEHPADFPPMPDARINGATGAYGDYRGSTPFPERLAPGDSASGWLHFTRYGTSRVMQIRLTYRNVTTDGYSTIQALSLVVAP